MPTQTPTYPGRSLIVGRLQGLMTEPKWIGWGDSTSGGGQIVTCNNWDVNLFDPLPETRTNTSSTAITTAQLADTYQVVATITATGTRSVREAGMFDTNSANSGSTSFNGSLTNVVTGSTLTNAQTGAWPSAGASFYAQLENEVILARWVDSTHVNLVTRGVLGSTAAAHNASAVVTVGGDGGSFTNYALGGAGVNVSAAQGGSMFAHADFALITVNVNDSIQFTFKDQFS